jgi:hypothetical protein
MKKILLLTTCIFIILSFTFSQDIIVLKNGDEIKSKVTEITTNELKYKKFENIDGPSYSIAKSDVFMIKYQNGTKDLFNGQQQVNSVNSSNTTNANNSAKVIFYRSKRFAGSAQDFIIGANIPDTVFIKLRNGTYHELLINDYRDWEFIGGTLSISASQKIKVEPQKT